MKRVLITGGTGFVGANLARRLLRDDCEVHLLVRPGHKTWRIDAIADKINLTELDLEDAERVAGALRDISPEWVFHLAANGAYSWDNDINEIARTNVIATANLLAASREAGAASFIHAGSSSEYGYKDHAPGECEMVEPNSYYAVTKAAATHLCSLFGAQGGMNSVTLRLYNVYGPFEHPARLIPTLLVAGMEGRLPPLVSPDVARDFVYVDDVCEAFVLAAARKEGGPAAVYNVGTGKQTTIGEAVGEAKEIFGISAEPEWGSMPNRRWDTACWVSDSERIRKDLGWRHSVPFSEGLRLTAEWLRNDPVMLEYYRVHSSL